MNGQEPSTGNNGALSEPDAAPRRIGAGMALGLRMGSGFISAVCVGLALGWGFDLLVGGAPWPQLGGATIGFVAGVAVAARAGATVPEQQSSNRKAP